MVVSETADRTSRDLRRVEEGVEHGPRKHVFDHVGAVEAVKTVGSEDALLPSENLAVESSMIEKPNALRLSCTGPR